MHIARQETDFATNSMKTPVNSRKTLVNSNLWLIVEIIYTGNQMLYYI